MKVVTNPQPRPGERSLMEMSANETAMMRASIESFSQRVGAYRSRSELTLLGEREVFDLCATYEALTDAGWTFEAICRAKS